MPKYLDQLIRQGKVLPIRKAIGPGLAETNYANYTRARIGLNRPPVGTSYHDYRGVHDYVRPLEYDKFNPKSLYINAIAADSEHDRVDAWKRLMAGDVDESFRRYEDEHGNDLWYIKSNRDYYRNNIEKNFNRFQDKFKAELEFTGRKKQPTVINESNYQHGNGDYYVYVDPVSGKEFAVKKHFTFSKLPAIEKKWAAETISKKVPGVLEDDVYSPGRSYNPSYAPFKSYELKADGMDRGTGVERDPYEGDYYWRR